MPKETTKKQRVSHVIEEVVDPVETPEVKPVEELPQADADTIPSPPAYTTQEKSKPGLGFIILIIIVAAFVALLTGALYVYFSGVKPAEPQEATPLPTQLVATPEPATNGAPNASPAPSIAPMKLASYKVSVLNGSGKPGEASKVKALLEKQGFKVGQTGNANTFDFTDTIIQIKSLVPADVVTKAQDAIGGAYSVKMGDQLTDKNTFDIIVTVGSK
jgi:hypothetical protein